MSANIEKFNETARMMDIMDVVQKLLNEKAEKFSTQEDLNKSKSSFETKMAKFSTLIFDIVKENRALREKVRILEEKRNVQSKSLAQLEDHVRQNNVIIRNVEKHVDLNAAVDSFVDDKLRMETPVDFENVKMIKDRGSKMDILVELKSTAMKNEMFSNATRLKGTRIVLEHDLGPERRQDKRVLIELKKELLAFSKIVIVRNDQLKVEGKYLRWSRNKKLMCGNMTGEEYFKTLYGDKAIAINTNYHDLLSRFQ